ncbi:MAG: hypothetical protein DME98_15515 [Verrucomicrobia bacterium]|nr:MAG: hypothetical protein DME98_15515 [Verrucomicrobiota bacterium]PYJ33555.1 MAG: hypothetical protein DME88_07995 [Verrucomicrobiota bacterium]
MPEISVARACARDPARFVGDYFPILHAVELSLFRSPHGNASSAIVRDDRRFMNVIRAIRILVALSGGNRFVRPLLTASSVIAVMPACMLMVPNPGTRNEWPAHCDEGTHYVWPFKFGAQLALVIVFAIAAHIPRKQNKAAKQHY